jgi:hypothetical protein
MVEKELALLEKTLAQHAYQEDRVRLLMTLPGLGCAAAQSLLAALGDVNRFQDGDHAASYLGLVPSTRQSANHCYHGPITKCGRSQTRWLLALGAHRLAYHPGPLGAFFRRLAKKKNHNVAVVATARKLVTIAYFMLKRNEPYRYAPPGPTQKKLGELRYAAIGQRLKYERLKSIQPPRKPQDGERVESSRSLPEVYQREGLTHPKRTFTLSAGERRMLNDKRLMGFFEMIQHPQRRIRRTHKAENGSPMTLDQASDQPPDGGKT